MSDFDDEPTTGSRSTTGGDEEPAAPTARPRRRPRDEDDVWDDEPAARPAKAKRPRPKDDDWDDEPARPARSKARRDDDDDDWDDDWDDDDRGGGRRDLTLVFAIAAAVLVIALVVVLTRPKDDDDKVATDGTEQTTGGTTAPLPDKTWQGPVAEEVGENSKDVQVRVDKETGVFIWTGFDGWHIRNKTDQALTVTVAAETVVDKTEGASEAAPVAELTITVPPGDGKTGADLDLGGSTQATFTVKQGETPVPAAEIKLGGKAGVADANPVILTKA